MLAADSTSRPNLVTIIPLLNSSLWARACQPIACLTFTCPRTELKDHSPSLGVTCESSNHCLVFQTGLPLQFSSYRNSSRCWVGPDAIHRPEISPRGESNQHRSTRSASSTQYALNRVIMRSRPRRKAGRERNDHQVIIRWHVPTKEMSRHCWVWPKLAFKIYLIPEPEIEQALLLLVGLQKQIVLS